MKNLIAFYGLDCESCEARKATVENDSELRKTRNDSQKQSVRKEKFGCAVKGKIWRQQKNTSILCAGRLNATARYTAARCSANIWRT